VANPNAPYAITTRATSAGTQRSEKRYGIVKRSPARCSLIERITESAQRRQYFLADLSEYFDDTSEWVFTDWCHLTSGASYYNIPTGVIRGAPVTGFVSTSALILKDAAKFSGVIT